MERGDHGIHFRDWGFIRTVAFRSWIMFLSLLHFPCPSLAIVVCIYQIICYQITAFPFSVGIIRRS